MNASSPRPLSVLGPPRGLLVAALLLSAGCRRRGEYARDFTPRPTASAPYITAAPNPPPSDPRRGSTTIVWETGDGTPGQVYVSVNGGPETFFSGTLSQHEDFAVYGYYKYVFTLYSGSNHEMWLASVKVSRRLPRLQGGGR